MVLDAVDNAVSLYSGTHRLGPITLASTTAAVRGEWKFAKTKLFSGRAYSSHGADQAPPDRGMQGLCGGKRLGDFVIRERGHFQVVKHVVGQSEPCVISSVSSTAQERPGSSRHSSEDLDEAELQLINGIVGDIPPEDSVFLDGFQAPGTSDSVIRSRIPAEKAKKLPASVSETLSIDIPPPGAKLRTGCIRFKCALNLGHMTKIGKQLSLASLGPCLGRSSPMTELY